MDLMLSVVADPDGANMLKHTKLFKSDGGSLGRADGNDWVLPDPQRVVSSRHAEIVFANNQYHLVDQSTNGTYHNQSGEPLGKGNRIALNDGDVIILGDYQLKVAIRRPAMESGLPKGLGGADFLDNADRTTFSPAAAAKMQSAQEAKELDSWLEPGASSNNQSGEWGYLASTPAADPMGSIVGQEMSVDPLQALKAGADSSSSLDPLAGFAGGAGGMGAASEFGGGFAATSSAGQSQWGDDEAWWKDGSEQDHAPAHNHAMQFSTTPAVEPQSQENRAAGFQVPEVRIPEVPPIQPVQSVQSQPQPPQVQASQGAPVHQAAVPAMQPQAETPAPAATPHPAEHNPFAESLSAMVGEQVQGAPGFEAATQATGQATSQATSQAVADTPAADSFAGASRSFSALPMETQAAQPQPQPQPPSQAQPGSGVLAEKLGLNLTAEQVQQLDQQAADIVEEAVSRLIDLLRARTSIKNELRVQRTMIQTQANNPLKFSATARDALGAMFAGNGAFMAPVEAVSDSFDDLSDHQVAVLAGMRAGYDAMLRFFNPDNIERRSGSQGGVFSSKSARNWENFVEMYRELISDPEACYRKLFGEEFATTYESQLSELKNARSFSK